MTHKENRNCPFCLSPVESGEEKVRCPKCGVVHHAECWKANGSCSVYGCDGWAVWSGQISERIAPVTQATVEVSKDSGPPRADEEVRCMKCGKLVKKGQLVCLDCRIKGDHNYLDNCIGTGVVMLLGAGTVIILIMKALT